MRKIPVLALFSVLAATFAAPAHAQPLRVWLSGVGVDSGTCPRQSPCHTLTYAHSQVAAGGEITVMDPGGYGTVNITKAVSIVSDSGSGEAGVATPPQILCQMPCSRGRDGHISGLTKFALTNLDDPAF